MMMMSIEWHLLAGFVLILGVTLSPIAYPPSPLLWMAIAMFLTPPLLACVAAIQAPKPRHWHWLSRPLIAWLHFRQPIARGWARYSVRLKNKVMKYQAHGYERPHDLPVDPLDRSTLCYWSSEHDRVHLLRKITDEVQAAGWRVRLDSGWGAWDMEIYGSRYVKVRVTTAAEHHDGKGKLIRLRIETLMSKFCLCLFVAGLILCGLLLLHVWPLSRTAVLIPLAWWAMFLVNRRGVGEPVLGLIDEVAEKNGYWPIPFKPAAQPSRRPVADDVDLEDHLPSIV